ncbi:hypothetical protein E3N88_26564 [Mikania micrantha]|uniref:Uncharacterized protein n=1 Tax=Mikania micrantha TaxID=192012 RepID=A0A5N6MU44_9ASTR|nr:hypothetical protein E3N88_26564 [Mikania micrantha]
MENKITKNLSDCELIALLDELSKYMIEGDLNAVDFICFGAQDSGFVVSERYVEEWFVGKVKLGRVVVPVSIDAAQLEALLVEELKILCCNSYFVL